MFVHQRIGVGLDVFRGGEAVNQRRVIDGGALRAEDIGGEQGDGLRQPLFKRNPVAHQRRLGTTIQPAFQPHLTEHHFRVRGVVFIYGDAVAGRVGDLDHLPPNRAGRQLAGEPLAEHDDVGGHLCVGVFLEGVVGQADGTDQVGLL